MYQFKQDLAMAYFPDHSNVAPSKSRESLLTMPSLSNVTEGKESASKRLANEIHSNFHFSPFNFQFPIPHRVSRPLLKGVLR